MWRCLQGPRFSRFDTIPDVTHTYTHYNIYRTNIASRDKNGRTDRTATRNGTVSAVGPGNHLLDGLHIGATWQIRLDECARRLRDGGDAARSQITQCNLAVGQGRRLSRAAADSRRDDVGGCRGRGLEGRRDSQARTTETMPR